MNTDQIVERDGQASGQLDQNQLQSTKVSLDLKATTTATKQRAGTQLLMSVTSMSITLESAGTETSALQSISV